MATIKEQMEEQGGLQPKTPAELPAATAITPTTIQELGDVDSLTLQKDVAQIEAPTLTTAAQVAAPTAVTKPTAPTLASTYEAYVDPQTPEAKAVTGSLSSKAIIGDPAKGQQELPQGVVSDDSIAVAATGEVDPRSTVKYQLEQLYQSFEEGGEPPAWASPAIRNVTAQMQARGLGASSMAAAAVTQSIIEAGIPIAKADADRYGAIQVTNLNNQQQAVLQNATVFASMDKANLDARMTAAVNNAKSFLAMDTQNLTGEQRVTEINYQGELQKLFNDQAAQNAARNFNAESQTQVDQFYSQLGVSVEAANANRKAAQQQFNVNEANAMKQFIDNLDSQRQQFNANMQAQIDQSNAQWRRQANTADTQAINEANRINAQNLFNMTAQAQNNLWNEYRDRAQWNMQTAENEKERDHQTAIAILELDGNQAMYEKEMTFKTAAGIGSFIRDIWD